MEVRIKITGDKETAKFIQQFARDIKSWRPELSEVGDYLKQVYERDVFETEGGILGQRWAPLQTAYDFWKRKNFGGRGTLERTGRMRKSFEKESSDNEVKVSNTAPYAGYHQFGTRRMPKRMLIDISKPQAEKIAEIVLKGLVKRINKG